MKYTNMNEKDYQIAEKYLFKEDHGKILDKDMTKALVEFEDFRAKVKQIVMKHYPEKGKDMVKSFTQVDLAFAALEKFVTSL